MGKKSEINVIGLTVIGFYFAMFFEDEDLFFDSLHFLFQAVPLRFTRGIFARLNREEIGIKDDAKMPVFIGNDVNNVRLIPINTI